MTATVRYTLRSATVMDSAPRWTYARLEARCGAWRVTVAFKENFAGVANEKPGQIYGFCRDDRDA